MEGGKIRCLSGDLLYKYFPQLLSSILILIHLGIVGPRLSACDAEVIQSLSVRAYGLADGRSYELSTVRWVWTQG